VRRRARGDIHKIGSFGVEHGVEVAVGLHPKIAREGFGFRSVEVASSHHLRTRDALPALHLNAAKEAAAYGDASKHVSSILDDRESEPRA
jgi:hypothetical protein